MVDLPAPVEPTMATVSPGLTLKEIPLITGLLSKYEK